MRDDQQSAPDRHGGVPEDASGRGSVERITRKLHDTQHILCVHRRSVPSLPHSQSLFPIAPSMPVHTRARRPSSIGTAEGCFDSFTTHDMQQIGGRSRYPTHPHKHGVHSPERRAPVQTLPPGTTQAPSSGEQRRGTCWRNCPTLTIRSRCTSRPN